MAGWDEIAGLDYFGNELGVFALDGCQLLEVNGCNKDVNGGQLAEAFQVTSLADSETRGTQLADKVQSYMTTKGVSNINLVGHSQGGFDIRKAAQDIVNGCTFDNNLPCIAEKEVVAVSSVVDELMHYMLTENDCYLASKEEQDKLVETVLAGGKLNRKCVGRDAKTLLSMIGVQAPANTRCIIFEGPKEHPHITTELMMPILGIVRAKDFDDAVEQAVWLEHGNRHSAHIHSKNIDNITKYAKAIDTAILVKNGPSYSALGFGGEGFCTFTIASRTGEGLTSASTFTKRRRCVMTDSLCIR